MGRVVIRHTPASDGPPASIEASWGVMGDSGTDEYRGTDDRAGGTAYEATTLGWLEQLAQPTGGTPFGGAPNHRSWNVGAWGTYGSPRRTGYAQGWMLSGNTMLNVLQDQMPPLASQIGAGTVTHAVLQCTVNGLGAWIATAYAGGDVSANVATYIDQTSDVIDGIVAAGVTGMIVMHLADQGVGPSGITGLTDPAGRQRVSDMYTAIREGIDAHIASVNTAEGTTRVVGVRSDLYFLPVWETVSGDFVTACGVQLEMGDSPDSSPLYTSVDGHLSTIMSGLYANAVLFAANQFPGINYTLLSDAEILENAGVA